MGAFFQWLATLSPSLVWSMFMALCLLLVIYPFHKQLKTILINKLSRVTPEIIDFSWRLTSDHFLFYLDNPEDNSEQTLNELKKTYSIDYKFTNPIGEYNGNHHNGGNLKRQLESFKDGFIFLQNNL